MSLVVERTYEPELTQRISEHLHPGDVFVDVGANMGYFTLLASKLVGEDGLVVACEPCPSNLYWLSYNVDLNGLTNVLVLSTALADQSALKRLTVPPLFNNGVSTLRERQNGSPTTPALVQRFDDLPTNLQENERVTLVKIDTEGLELEVLRGMQQLLTSGSSRLAIACELSPQWYDLSTLVSLFSQAGFEGEYYCDGRWQRLHDGSLPSIQCNAWFQRVCDAPTG